MNSTIPRDSFAAISTYFGRSEEPGCVMRFWVYMKSSYNGQLAVGYRYEIGDDMKPLSFSSYQSCATNATLCSWQRIDVALGSVLTQPTEVRANLELNVDFHFVRVDHDRNANWR